MASEPLTSSLQESVLTALCFGGAKSNAIANIVKAEYFMPPLDEIAAKAIEYRQTFGEAPGEGHLDDILDHLAADDKQASTYQYILVGMMRQKDHLNEDYVLSRLHEFVKRASQMDVVERAAMRIQQGGENVSTEVEEILDELRIVRADLYDPGTSLADIDKALSFLDEDSDNDRLRLGIEPLDSRGIVPTRGEMLLLEGPRGGGKSWFCTHVTTCGFLDDLRVLDISLEMSEKRRAQRLVQSLFAVAKHSGDYERTALIKDEHDHLVELVRESMEPELTLGDKDGIRSKLNKKMGQWGKMLDNIKIKQFPTGQLTVSQLIGYLDYLDAVHRFVPDVLIVDYPALMWKDIRDPRISNGMNFERLRGLAVERNLMLVCPHQANREGEKSKLIQSYHAAEDISVMATADNAISINTTPMEKKYNLARLHVMKARNDEDRFTFLISQDYRSGQFFRNYAQMQDDYWTKLDTYNQGMAGRKIEGSEE